MLVVKKEGSKKNSFIIYIFMFLCLIPTMIFMSVDDYRTGDEIVSYGMANEPAQGWMFSKGRIRTYMDDYILDANVLKTLGNVVDAGMDIVVQ